MTQRRNRTRNKPRLQAVEDQAQNGPIQTPLIEKLFITPGENVDLSTATAAELYGVQKELLALMVMALGEAGAAMQSVYNGLGMLAASADEAAGRLLEAGDA